jgi:hypothetical protein
MIESIIDAGGVVDEHDFVQAYSQDVECDELRKFVSRLEQAGAIDVVGTVR